MIDEAKKHIKTLIAIIENCTPRENFKNGVTDEFGTIDQGEVQILEAISAAQEFAKDKPRETGKCPNCHYMHDLHNGVLVCHTIDPETCSGSGKLPIKEFSVEFGDYRVDVDVFEDHWECYLLKYASNDVWHFIMPNGYAIIKEPTLEKLFDIIQNKFGLKSLYDKKL